MIVVQFPPPDFRTKEAAGKRYIFDGIRKTWLLLTEEEWVRQNVVQYLIQSMHYPSTVIALEKSLMLNDLKKRFDLLVYDKGHQPWMMVECKSPSVPLSEHVLQQVLRYNMSVPVRHLIITNGKSTLGWERSENGLKPLTAFPDWEPR